MLRTEWRLFIFLMVSVGCHLALLTVQLHHDNGNLSGERYAVGQVADKLDNFAPDRTRIAKITSVKKVAVDSPLSQVRHSQVETLTVKPHPILKPIVQPSDPPSQPENIEVAVAEPPVPTETGRDTMTTEQVAAEPGTENTVIAALADQATVSAAGLNRSASDSTVFDSPLIHAVPRYADNPRPAYPDVARRKGWTGEVRLLVRVNEVGRVDQIAVERTSGFSALDRAARRAVRLWRFIPATEAGRKVSSEVVVPIDFHLPASAKAGVSIQE